MTIDDEGGTGSRFAVIDLNQLPPFQVLETIDTEAIIAARMTRFVAVWNEHDPPAAAGYDVASTEFDPIVIVEECNTYFELMLRDRVNQACRDVTLAFAWGGNLDAIASRYPGGVPRQPVVDNPRPSTQFPQDWENDATYRRRIWLSPNALSPHGTEEGYDFYSLTALASDATLRDASATTREGTGEVYVTIIAGGTPVITQQLGLAGEVKLNSTLVWEPRPTEDQLLAARLYVLAKNRKALTDMVSIAGPRVIDTKYSIRVWAFPGPDPAGLLANLNAALLALIEKQRWLGYDHTLMAINAAIGQNGVYNAIIDQPAADLLAAPGDIVRVTAVELTYIGRGE